MPIAPAALDLLYREKVAAARSMTPEQRVLACFELTEFAWCNIQAGVRDRFPAASDAEVRRLACERVASIRKLHERR
jgi:hypothetical protein